MSTILYLKKNYDKKVIAARNINRPNKLRSVNLDTCVKNTINTSTTQSQLVQSMFERNYTDIN